MPNYLSPGVYVEEVEAGSRPIEGVGTAVAGFVGLAARGPANAPTLVTNWAQFVMTFGDFIEGSYLAHAVYGYFLNGGGACYVVRIGGDSPMPHARADIVTAKDGATGSYRVVALEPGPAGNQIKVDITEATGADSDTFNLTVTAPGQEPEVYEGLTSKRGKTNVVTAVKERSKLIQLEEIGTASALERVPAKGSVSLAGADGAKPMRLTPDDYVGDSADRTGFAGLEAVDSVTMLAVPDLMAVYQKGILDLEGVQAVQQAMIAHCELMGDRVAILDAPPGLNAQQIREWRVDKASYDSKYATLYWPWIKVSDPVTSQSVFVPPSGHMAGIWARNDDTRGVHKAPANEVIRGALALELQITKAEHDQLNPTGINCIRAFPGRGIRVWGARTLSSDSAWRYLNVRRLFNYVEESIIEGTQWVVFEPNDLNLWQRVKRTLNAFLVRTWRDGALFGATPGEAFYVKCDAETNPPDVVDAGQLVVEVGIAPVKPAEFVVFRIAQFSGGAALEE
ncbi:MAG TPA: phage tail sheath subtilisin-like domain-containing protein [Candidatus Limnocylindrales bacterium]|nr:phage tail sheath subtilisin-like domain-containing protein [Candidatus Limnocylindrales bacterium]